MEGKVVKVVKSGEATLVFHDDYCQNKSPEEIKKTLDRIAALALPGLKASYLRKESSA